MGKRGTKPTPTRILLNRGSWRGKLRKDEPVYEVVKSIKPLEILNPEGEQFWQQVSERLKNQGVLTECDMAAFNRYCFYWQKWQTMVNKPRTKVNELFKLESMLLKLECQFGLTPASRPNIKASANGNENEKETEKEKGKQKPNYFKLA